MKKLIWFMALACLVVATHGWAEDDYQQKMFQFLFEGLTTELRDGDYNKFYGYVKEQHLKNKSFQEFEKQAGWKVTYKDDGGYCYFGINDSSLEVHKLPLYPILENDTATIASFYEKDELNYLQLPGFLKAYFDKIEKENNLKYEQNYDNPDFGDIESLNQSIGVNQLKKDIPLFFNQKIWLISEQGSIETELESMVFRTICSYGYYQITANLKKTTKNPVFAFQSDNIEKLPVIVRPKIDASKIPFDFQNKPVFIAPIDEKGKLVFIGSNNNTTSEFYLIWDTVARQIVYLQMYSGYCLGNEPRFLNRNYLFKYNGNYYSLRYSHTRSYAEVLYFNGSNMTVIYHADTTAPEI